MKDGLITLERGSNGETPFLGMKASLFGGESNTLVDDVAQMPKWYKYCNGTNVKVRKMLCGAKVMVVQMSHFIKGDTNVTFLLIGGSYVDLIKGGTNVKWDRGTSVRCQS
jgi:hypothetical protein